MEEQRKEEQRIMALEKCNGRCEDDWERNNSCSKIKVHKDVIMCCTLKKGHSGNHVACGIAGHNYLLWDDETGEIESEQWLLRKGEE
jgi:hypothetical protein